MLLTPEKIKQAIKEAHKRNPGKILPAMEIYEAIAQAQYDEDIPKEVKHERSLELMTIEEVKEFTRRYREAIAKGLGCSSWEEALAYLAHLGVDVSHPDLRRTSGQVFSQEYHGGGQDE